MIIDSKVKVKTTLNLSIWIVILTFLDINGLYVEHRLSN